MAIAQFSELKTALANYTKRDDLTSRIPEFVSLAEDRIGLDLRVRAMETSADLTIASGTRTVALPTRFVQQRRIYLDSTIKQLDFFESEDFWTRQAQNETGRPKMYTIEGENFVFGPEPDAAYTGKLLYYQKFAALSGDTDTNWILTNARGLYLYGALIEASPYLEDDPRALTWSALYEDLLDRVHKADKRDRHPNRLQQRTTVTTT